MKENNKNKLTKPMFQRLGKTQQKILLLLLGGVTIGLSGSPKTAFKVIRAVKKEWEEIDRSALRRSVAALKQSKLVVARKCNDGSTELSLSRAGEYRATAYSIGKISLVRAKHWDGNWRIVMFDVPEKFRHIRNTLRFQMNRLGFTELQKSVFVYPYPCRNEIEYLVKFYHAEAFVHLVVARSIDNDDALKKYFHITTQDEG